MTHVVVAMGITCTIITAKHCDMVIISRLICNNLNLQTLSHSLKNLDIKVEVNAQSGKSWRTAILIDILYLCLVWFGLDLNLRNT